MRLVHVVAGFRAAKQERGTRVVAGKILTDVPTAAPNASVASITAATGGTFGSMSVP